MAEYGVTVWNSVPALLSGDWIPLQLRDMLIQRVSSAQVVGLDGATEASIWPIFHIYQGLRQDWSSIPYGRPLANQEFRVLDEKWRDCQVWVSGELDIGGAGLAVGGADRGVARPAWF